MGGKNSHTRCRGIMDSPIHYSSAPGMRNFSAQRAEFESLTILQIENRMNPFLLPLTSCE